MTEKEVEEWFKKYMPYGMTVTRIPKEDVLRVEEFDPEANRRRENGMSWKTVLLVGLLIWLFGAIPWFYTSPEYAELKAESEAIFAEAGVEYATPENIDRLMSAREVITGK